MNQSKFSLADVLTVLAALAFGFVCFMGVNFLNINNNTVWGMAHTIGCIIMAVVCALLLFLTAFGAKLLKRTSRNFKSCLVGEVILIILFVLIAVFFASKTSPFTHFFTVASQRSEINKKLRASIEQAENMFSEYELYANNRIIIYEKTLNTVTNIKRIDPKQYTAHGFINNNVSDDKQIETKIFSLNADLFPSNYSDTIAKNGIKEVATKWLQNAKKHTKGWKPIGIVGVVNDIEKNTHEWLNTLVSLSKSRAKHEQTTDFEYKLSFEDVKTHFTKLDRPSPLSLVLAVLAYMLMLLSWYVTKRSTRFPGFKLLFGLGKSNDNEL